MNLIEVIELYQNIYKHLWENSEWIQKRPAKYKKYKILVFC